jgi:hypothetical protein
MTSILIHLPGQYSSFILGLDNFNLLATLCVWVLLKKSWVQKGILIQKLLESPWEMEICFYFFFWNTQCGKITEGDNSQ